MAEKEIKDTINQTDEELKAQALLEEKVSESRLRT